MLYSVLPKRLAEEDSMRAEMLAKVPAVPLPKRISPFVDGLTRFLLGGIGGGFSLVPIIVMTFVLDPELEAGDLISFRRWLCNVHQQFLKSK